MNTHVIYIPHTGQENVLSQQLAHAFAKFRCASIKGTENTTMVVQYGSNLKPLEFLTPKDTLQILFTPIHNLKAPLHTQTNAKELLRQVPMLINHLLQDGLDPTGCTIQLYTLQHLDQNAELIKETARELVALTHTENLTIEWHVIPKLTSLTQEQLNQIFDPNITCQLAIHAFLQELQADESAKIKLIETHGAYTYSQDLH
ncbi:MAG: hypothetical protein KBD64_00410 [Gammaproteobacteria bacterium]|nr:hypothetical protein [Gammaproteobacteria bacterium]